MTRLQQTVRHDNTADSSRDESTVCSSSSLTSPSHIRQRDNSALSEKVFGLQPAPVPRVRNPCMATIGVWHRPDGGGVLVGKDDNPGYKGIVSVRNNVDGCDSAYVAKPWLQTAIDTCENDKTKIICSNFANCHNVRTKLNVRKTPVNEWGMAMLEGTLGIKFGTNDDGAMWGWRMHGCDLCVTIQNNVLIQNCKYFFINDEMRQRYVYMQYGGFCSWLKKNYHHQTTQDSTQTRNNSKGPIQSYKRYAAMVGAVPSRADRALERSFPGTLEQKRIMTIQKHYMHVMDDGLWWQELERMNLLFIGNEAQGDRSFKVRRKRNKRGKHYAASQRVPRDRRYKRRRRYGPTQNRY